MKSVISILTLMLAINLGTALNVEKSCSMAGCSVKAGKMMCCSKTNNSKPCCTTKYSCKKTDFDAAYQPAVQVVIAKQINVFDAPEISFIPNTSSLLKIDNFKRQKFKPDLQLNSILLI